MGKLDKYSSFINMLWKDKLDLIKKVKVIQDNDKKMISFERKSFEQENFMSLSVFDSIKQQNMYKLQTYRQNSKGQPKAIVTYFHGLGSHMGLSANLANYFAQRNITTVGYDYRGFGKSQGPRAYIQNLQSHTQDAQKFMKLVQSIYPTTPIFATGLSLGGLTAYQLTLKHPEWFKGALLMAPALMPSMQLSNKLNTILNILSFLQIFLSGNIGLRKPNFQEICRYRSGVEVLKNDQLYIKQRVPLRTLSTILTSMQRMPRTFEKYSIPFLMIMGGRDKLIDPHVAFELFSKSSTPEKDKDILFYQEMWHNILYQSEIGQIQQKMADWILARC